MNSCQILKIHGHLLEPRRSPAIDNILKSYRLPGEAVGMLYADEKKENPACQSGLLPYLRRRVPVRRGGASIRRRGVSTFGHAGDRAVICVGGQVKQPCPIHDLG